MKMIHKKANSNPYAVATLSTNRIVKIPRNFLIARINGCRRKGILMRFTSGSGNMIWLA